MLAHTDKLNPDYGTLPKWVWNAPLANMSREQIFEEFESFTQKDHYSGVMVVLWGHDGYLSEDYMTMYGYALEAAKHFGMHMIIWDENGFPSGLCNGEIDRDYPQYTAHRLDKEEYDCTGDRFSCHIGQDFEAAIAWNTDTNEVIDIASSIEANRLLPCIAPTLKWTVPKGHWKVMVFYCRMAEVQTNYKYRLVDYLNKDAVQKFIELVHQRYYDRFSEYFGSVIKYAFYDEPSMYHVQGGRMWTKGYKDLFTAKHGFSPATLYPALWYDIGADTAWARNLLYGLRADLYTGYVSALATWCEQHGIQLTGHMDQEEIVNQTHISGDLIKVFKDQHVPGVDEIGFYGRGSIGYKVISSAAITHDRERVMCEVYGAMGEGMPVEVLMKEAIDELAKGINLFVPHGTWYNGDPNEVVFPPELSYRSAKYAAPLREYNDFATKASELLAPGRTVCDIAVLYPVHDFQAQTVFDAGDPYLGGINPAYSDYLRIGELLALDIRHDFMFLHPEVLDERCSIQGKELHMENKINFQNFKVLIVPGAEVISLSNAKMIEAFQQSGGVVISTSKLPSQSVERGSNEAVCDILYRVFCSGSSNAYLLPNCNAQVLGEVLQRSGVVFDVSIDCQQALENGNLSYMHKENADEDIYFIGNSSDTALSASVQLSGDKRVCLLDPMTGQTTPIAAKTEGNNTRLTLYLKPIQSVFICAAK